MGYEDKHKKNKCKMMIIVNENQNEVIEFDMRDDINEIIKNFIEKYQLSEEAQQILKSRFQEYIINENEKIKEENLNIKKKVNNSVERLYYQEIVKKDKKNVANKIIKEKLDECYKYTFSPKISYSPFLMENRNHIRIEDKLIRDGLLSKERKILYKLKKSLEIRESKEIMKINKNKFKKVKSENSLKNLIKEDNKNNENNIHKENQNLSQDKIINSTIFHNNNKFKKTFSFRDSENFERKFSLEKSLKLSEKSYTSKFLQKLPEKQKIKVLEFTHQKNENLITDSNCQSPNSLKTSKLYNNSNLNLPNSITIAPSNHFSDDISNFGSINLNLQDKFMTSYSRNNKSFVNIKSLANSINVSSKAQMFEINSTSSRNIKSSYSKINLDKLSTKLDSLNHNLLTQISKPNIHGLNTNRDEKLSNHTINLYKLKEESIKGTSDNYLVIKSKKKIEGRKETKEEFYNRLSSKIESKSLINQIVEMRKKIFEESPQKKKLSRKSNTPCYLIEDRRKSRDKLSRELLEKLSKKESIEKNIKHSNSKNMNESLKNFRLNKLKEIFEIIYKNVDNIEEIDILYKLGIPFHLVDQLIKPTCYIMQTKGLEFNFRNFYEIADEILQLIVI